MSIYERLEGPPAWYIEYGDNRPPMETLTEVVTYLEKDSDEPDTRLLLADALIDLAMADNQNEQSLDKSGEKLQSLIDDVAAMESQGFRRLQIRFAGAAVSAALRLGELASWREAARGEQVNPDYESFLAGTWQAYQFAALNYNAMPFLRESIPVLLGLRARERQAAGWISRLSLAREDRDIPETRKPDHNPNWDVGITTAPTASSYGRPQVRAQVKTHQDALESDREYEREGIIVLYAKALGFDEAPRIIRSCLKEYDPTSIRRSTRNKRHNARFLTSGELDELTGKIADAIDLSRLVGEEGIEPSIR